MASTTRTDRMNFFMMNENKQYLLQTGMNLQKSNTGY